MLDISKSVTYIFDDSEWITKLGILLVVGLAAAFLMPVLFLGLVFVAAQTGWTIELIRNVMRGEANPMPTWEGFSQKIQAGVQPMIAGVVYFLPIIVLACLLYVPAILAGSASEDVGAVFASGASCLLVPLMLVYFIAAFVFLQMGFIRYVQTEQLSDFFKFGDLWEMFMRDTSLTTRFVLYMALVTIVMNVIGSTGIGGLITAAFTAPITGHLTGQFANALNENPRRA